MNTPCVAEVEVANEDENVDYATTRDQNDRKQKGNVDDPYAECEYCGALYTSHSKRNRMENMEAHPGNYCDEYPFGRTYCGGAENGDRENLILESEEEEEEEEEECVGENCGFFDSAVAKILIAKMIIIDKLPLRFVEDKGFRRFLEQTVCKYAPQFVIPSLRTVARHILEIYLSEKQSLRKILSKKVLEFLSQLILGRQIKI